MLSLLCTCEIGLHELVQIGAKSETSFRETLDHQHEHLMNEMRSARNDAELQRVTAESRAIEALKETARLSEQLASARSECCVAHCSVGTALIHAGVFPLPFI